jgi:signal transduction histidine kinase
VAPERLVNTVRVDLAERYEQALREYLGSRDEQLLWRAYELGREAMETGVGILGLVMLHRNSLGQSPDGPADPAGGNGVVDAEATSVFLLEALAPFEMAHRVFARGTGELRRRTESLRESATRQKGALLHTLEVVEGLETERKRLIADLVDAEDRERRRISREIHDDSLQVLAAVRLRLETMARTEPDPEQLRGFETVLGSLKLASERLRRLLFRLRPPELERRGLGDVLQSCLEDLSAESGIDYEMDDQLDGAPPPEVGTVLWRVAQEALANVRKHACAKHVAVTLAKGDGGYLLRIKDDGLGFEPSEHGDENSRHFGLAVMRERTEMVGGDIRVESLPGAGTVVEFWVPGDRHADGAGQRAASQGIGSHR